MSIFKSVCPYDCPDACGLLVEVENNRVVKVKGNPDHAFTRGILCPKMNHYEDTVYSPLRLTTPLRRIGPKGSNKFEPISWDQALDLVAKNFLETIERYGSESILRYSYAGTMGLVQKEAGNFFFRRIGATQQDRGICSPAKTYGYTSVMGTTMPIKPQEAQASDFVVMWGLNAMATDIHFLADVKVARQKGAQIWVIDTHETYTFSQADHHIKIRPGSDGAFALGVMHILKRDGLVDEDFVRDYVQGYEELASQVLDTYTPTFVSQITHVPVELIEQFAKDYGQAKAPFIRLGSGLSRYGNGATTVRLITCLPALVGAWAKYGGGLLASAGGSQHVGRRIMDNLEVPTEKTRLMPMVQLGHMLTEEKEQPIHSLYIYSSNPAITAPDQNVVRQGLMRDDLFTVVHERFFTDTCSYADIILPATTSLEHDDVYNSYGHYTIAAGYQVIPPIGQSRSNWDVFRDLAKRMGLEDTFFNYTSKELVERIVKDADSNRVSDEDKKKILSGEPVEMTLPVNYKLDIKTPSGKIEIYNSREKFPLPDFFEPYGDEADLWLINGNDIRILDSSFCEREFGDAKDIMVCHLHPKDAEKRQLVDGQAIKLFNVRGTVKSTVKIDEKVLPGTIVVLGVWWQRYSSDSDVGINALTAQRPTDFGWGSTFYDVKVNVSGL